MTHGVATTGGRRGLVILVVMVVVTLSALIGSSVLLLGEDANASTTFDRRATQARLSAWSGVQAVMARLHDQREDLLLGATPDLPESWTFPIETDGAPPAFRLIGGDGEVYATSENAKLDVNLATAEMLAALPMIDERLAQAIVAARPFGSIPELGMVEGVTPELLYGGQLEPGEAIGGADATDPGGVLEGNLTLADVLTVFSFDPNIQIGVGEKGEAHAGNRRINLGLGWSDQLERGVRERWDESAAAFLQSLFEQGAEIKKTSDVVALYRRFGLSPSDWAEGLDALTVIESEHVRGLVDLNHASAVVLSAVPGIDEDAARAIVDARERLSLDQRTSIVWPLVEGMLDEDAFKEASDWLTTRSTQWRVRVEGGTLEPGQAPGADPLGEAAPLLDRVVLECVLDVSSRRPRVAYLRDVTGLDLALAMRRGTEFEETPAALALPEDLVEPAPEDADLFDLSMPTLPEALGETPEPSHDAGESDPDAARPGGRIGRWTTGEEGTP